MSYRSAAPATSVACTFTIAVSPTNEHGSMTPPGSTWRDAIVTSFAVQLFTRPVRSSTQVWASPGTAVASRVASPTANRMAGMHTANAIRGAREKVRMFDPESPYGVGTSAPAAPLQRDPRLIRLRAPGSAHEGPPLAGEPGPRGFGLAVDYSTQMSVMCLSDFAWEVQKQPLNAASRPKLIFAFGAVIDAVMTAL